MATNETDACGSSLPTVIVGSTQNAGMDYNHPLFSSPADQSGIQIVSFQLTGIENYSTWYRSIRIALLGRNKIGLVD